MYEQLGCVVGVLLSNASSNNQIIGDICGVLTHQRKFNRKVALFAGLTSIYIVKNELRANNQKAQIKKFQREIDALKNSKEDSMKGE